LIISQIPLAPFAKGGIRTVSPLGRGLRGGLESEIYTLNTEEPYLIALAFIMWEIDAFVGLI